MIEMMVIKKSIPQDAQGLLSQYTIIIKNPHKIKIEKREVGIT